jgi:hypothetical protein
MNFVSPRHFVDDQFPPRLRHLIPTTLKTAYRDAERIIADTPILSMAEKRGERGRIIAYAVDFGFNGSNVPREDILPFAHLIR